MQGNTLVRNALNEDLQNGTAIESGGVELSFGQNVQVLNNNIETLNAPADESVDGEAITTQHSNIPDILDAGSATSITSTTLTDTRALWDAATIQGFNTYPGTVIVIPSPSPRRLWPSRSLGIQCPRSERCILCSDGASRTRP
jgi:hypothetical protein